MCAVSGKHLSKPRCTQVQQFSLPVMCLQDPVPCERVSLGMRRAKVWEWDEQRSGNETSKGMGMRQAKVWEWGYTNQDFPLCVYPLSTLKTLLCVTRSSRAFSEEIGHVWPLLILITGVITNWSWILHGKCFFILCYDLTRLWTLIWKVGRTPLSKS